MVGGPADHGLRLGLVRRPLPRPRAGGLLAAVRRVAHDPGHDRGRAGAIGLAACGFLLWSAFAVAFGGPPGTLRRRQAGVVVVGRCVVAAAFCALLLHTFVYAAFLEDPLTWALLAMAAALRQVEPEAAAAPEAAAEGAGARRSPFRPERPPTLHECAAASVLIAVAAVTILLGVGVAVAAYLSFLQPEDQPPAPRATLRAPHLPGRPAPTPTPPKPRPDTFKSGATTATPGPSPLLRAAGFVPRPVPDGLEAQGAGAARVPARDVERLDLPARRQRPARVAAQDERQDALEEQAGPPGRVRTGARRPPGVRDAARERPLRRSRPGRGAAPARRPRRWSRTLPPAASPRRCSIAAALYFGSEDGTLYCLSAGNGQVSWRYRAAGAIKGSPTLAHGTLFFGDYGGQVQAVRARNGRRVWSSSGGGRLYATAAVAGRKCSSAARPVACSRSRRATAGCAGHIRPAATCTPRRR